MKVTKGDHVVFTCQNPATGWVVRVSKDGTWADVEWNPSRDCRYVSRAKTVNLLKTNPIFNRLNGDPGARVFVPEAQQFPPKQLKETQ